LRRILVVLNVLGALIGGAWYAETRWPVRRAGEPPQPLVVEPGMGVRDIGRQLHGMGLVRHPEIFRALVLSKRAAGRLRAGEYSFEGTMSLSDIADKMIRGDVVRRTVTFPEGTSLADMARIVATRGIPIEDFQKAAKNVALVQDLDPEADDLEGYLFPDTYDLPRTADPAGRLVGQMVKRFRGVITPLLPKVQASGRPLREVLTLASIVELETARGEERPRVASVFLNRLKRRMPLQTDPTVIYALRRAGRYDGNIRRADLDVDSPYNTYRYPGLPPGPIANPGRLSIQAVLDPAATRDVYFVSRNDGSHEFSETLEQHNRWVTLYQRRGVVGSGPGLADPQATPSGAPVSPPPSAAPSAPPRGQ
jgi:UPF0755 protein